MVDSDLRDKPMSFDLTRANFISCGSWLANAWSLGPDPRWGEASTEKLASVLWLATGGAYASSMESGALVPGCVGNTVLELEDD